jgi:5'-methylthioadenosine nucleosidase
MEAAAIGYVCTMTSTPLLPVKSVTDWVDHHAPTESQFFENYQIAVKNLTTALLEILKGAKPQ